jgi:hypothetical protein
MGNILKTSVILSAIAGLAAGFLLLIPFLTPLIFLMLFVIIGAGVVVYLKKNELVGILSIQDGTLIGAVSGFVSLAAASVVYLPLLFIINLIFGTHLNQFGLSNSLTIISYNLIFAVMMVFFTGLLSAVFNAFTGMVAAYIYEKIETRPFDFDSHLEIEQDD